VVIIVQGDVHYGTRFGDIHTRRECVFVFIRTFATRLPLTQDRAFMFNRLRLLSAIYIVDMISLLKDLNMHAIKILGL